MNLIRGKTTGAVARMSVAILLLPGDGVGATPGAVARPGLVLEEFVYETAPFPSSHAATILE